MRVFMRVFTNVSLIFYIIFLSRNSIEIRYRLRALRVINPGPGCQAAWPNTSDFPDGQVDDGQVDDGWTDDGQMDDGQMDDGQVDDGQVDDGQMDDEQMEGIWTNRRTQHKPPSPLDL